ncbi:MAG: hypothetical protein ACI8PP_002031 [Candidatus Pseudothioglobus sp.]
MKNLILMAVLAYGGYEAWQRFGAEPPSAYPQALTEPLFDSPYVAVYGRDSCGLTQNLLKKLKASNIEHHYYRIDEKPIADRLHATMIDQNMDVRGYDLPVVDVSGDLSVRPSLKDIKIKL